MKEIGLVTVERAASLNDFYSENVRPTEKFLRAGKGTTLYAMFLASAHSFKCYAKDLIANSSKSKLYDFIATSEVFTLKAIVVDLRQS
jgi:hypothetical protein